LRCNKTGDNKGLTNDTNSAYVSVVVPSKQYNSMTTTGDKNNIN